MLESKPRLNDHSATTEVRTRWPIAVEYSLVVLVAGLLTGLFWLPLFKGGGFIGGDTYNYFFPLKQFYAEGLKAGEIRLWHPGIGNGVPVLGESQTGVFYPFNLLAYRLLDLNTAYNAIFLFHYVLATVFAFALARAVGMGGLAAMLSAVVFVYGWFPPRACLEWAVVTGAWMPAALFFTLRYLQTGRRGWWLGISLSFGVVLLAGHFHLAWVTVLSTSLLSFLFPFVSGPTHGQWKRVALSFAGMAIGFGLAGVQLVPTWELKARSQRSEEGFREEVFEGTVPPGYFPQAILPWHYYADPDARLAELGARTNKIEAHLYFGLIPLALAACSILLPSALRRGWPWLIMAAIGAVLACGIVMPCLADLPGFGFFRYSGRYGLATQLGVAVLAGLAVDSLLLRRSSGNRVKAAMGSVIATCAILAATLFDLYWVGHQVQYVTIVNPPVIDSIDSSPVFAKLQPTDRVMAVDGNTLAMSGAACVPPYLGMGPAEYYKIWDAMPDVFHGQTRYSDAIGQTFDRMGVTHLLVFDPLPSGWPVSLIFSGYDPFLHRRWARAANEPIYLYRFDAGNGRAYVRGTEGNAQISELRPHRVTIDVDLDSEGDVVLTDLSFPGWSVTVDGEVKISVASGLERIVRVPGGKHQVVWSYWPWSVVWGGAISILSSVVFVVGLFMHRLIARFRRQATDSNTA